MKTARSAINALLSEPGVSLPSGLLSRLDIEEYLDRLDRKAALVAAERERLGEVLRAAENLTPRRHTERICAGQGDELRPGAVSVGEARHLPQEQELVLEFQREQTSAASGSGRHALGNILIAGARMQIDNQPMLSVVVVLRLTVLVLLPTLPLPQTMVRPELV